MAGKKTLVRKTVTTDTLTIYGVLDGDLNVVSPEDGTVVNLTERILEFEGETIALSLRKADEDVVEVIE